MNKYDSFLVGSEGAYKSSKTKYVRICRIPYKIVTWFDFIKSVLFRAIYSVWASHVSFQTLQIFKILLTNITIFLFWLLSMDCFHVSGTLVFSWERFSTNIAQGCTILIDYFLIDTCLILVPWKTALIIT